MNQENMTRMDTGIHPEPPDQKRGTKMKKK